MAAVILLGVLTACGPGAASRQGKQGESPLPGDEFVAGWHRKGRMETVSAGGLYQYIDGGAEVFLQAGFQRLVVQSYTNGTNEIEAQLYVMRDSSAAQAVWERQGGAAGGVEGLTAPAAVDRYQLKALLKCCYVVIDNPSGNDAALGVMKTLARRVAKRTGELCGG